jgi:hypothetical protein
MNVSGIEFPIGLSLSLLIIRLFNAPKTNTHKNTNKRSLSLFSLSLPLEQKSAKNKEEETTSSE